MEYNPEYKRMYNRYLSAFSTNINKAREQLNSISVPNDFSKKSDIDGIKRRLKEVDVLKVQREIDIICANIEKSERDAINAKFASMDINAPSMALNPLNRNTNRKNNELNPHSLNAIFNSQQNKNGLGEQGGLWENTKAFLANSMEISYEAQQLQTQANIEMAQKTGADIINTATALFWGIISGGEKIVDAFATFGTNFIIEQTQNELRDMEEDGHKDDKFREKTEKELETLRVNTMAYVAEEKTNNYFENEIYDSTFMQNVNETAHNPFKKEAVAFELTKGVGEAIPIITAGVVSGGKAWAIAATSAVIGFGNASQENLQRAKENSIQGLEEKVKTGEMSQEEYDEIIRIHEMTSEEIDRRIETERIDINTIRAFSDEDLENIYLAGGISTEIYEQYKKIRQLTDEEINERLEETREYYNNIANISDNWQTENVWNNTLAYSSIAALWEGAQGYVGSVLNTNPLGMSQLAASVVNVTIDSTTSFADTIVRAGARSLVEGSSFTENFEELGGLTQAFINAGTGGTTSFIFGELPDLIGARAEGTLLQVNTTQEAKKLLNNIDALNDIDKNTSKAIKEQIIFDVNSGIIDIDNLKKKTSMELLEIFDSKHPGTLDNNVRKLISQGDVAEYVNDPIGFIRSRFYEIDSNGNIKFDNDGNPKLLNVRNLTDGQVYCFYSQLTQEDKNTFLRLLTNKKTKISSEEIEFLQTYSRAYGFYLDAYLRNTKIYQKEGIIDGTNRAYIDSCVQEAYKFVNEELYGDKLRKAIDVGDKKTVKRLDRIIYKEIDMDVEEKDKKMDEFIEKQPPIKESIIVSRNVDSLWFNGNELADIKPGTIFNDRAFLATSIDEGNFGKERRIKLEIEIPEGTKVAYIQPNVRHATGYGMQEVVLGRNNAYEIVEYKVVNNKTYIRAKLVQQDPSIIKTINAENVGKRNMNTKLYDRYINASELKRKQVDFADVVASMKKNGNMAKYEAEVRDLRISGFYKDTIPEHGADHVEKVLFNAMYIGQQEGLNNEEMKVLIEAAKYHDTGRASAGVEHGIQGAKASGKYLINGHSEDEVAMIQAAIHYHAIPDNEMALGALFEIYNVKEEYRESVSKIAAILKDADALDRSRFPGNLDASFLRTKTAQSYVKASYQLQELRGQNYINKLLLSDISIQNKQIINNLRKAGFADYEISYWITSQNYPTLIWQQINENIQSVLGGMK